MVEVDERDEVVEALVVGLAYEIHAIYLADLLKLELLADEGRASTLVLQLGVIGTVTRKRASVAARDIEGHVELCGDRGHVCDL